jgi:hypothetical protein
MIYPTVVVLADLWSFNRSSLQWKYLRSQSSPSFGTKSVQNSSSLNYPDGRQFAGCFADNFNNMFLIHGHAHYDKGIIFIGALS